MVTLVAAGNATVLGVAAALLAGLLALTGARVSAAPAGVGHRAGTGNGAAAGTGELAQPVALLRLLAAAVVPSSLRLEGPQLVRAGRAFPLSAEVSGPGGEPVAGGRVSFYYRAPDRRWARLAQASTGPDGLAEVVVTSGLTQSATFGVRFLGDPAALPSPRVVWTVRVSNPDSPEAVLLANLDTDSAAALATAILADPNVEAVGFDVRTDLVDSAEGRPGSSGAMVSATLLRLILAVGEAHTVAISAIESGGTGHCYNAAGVARDERACPADPHYRGLAADFAAVDGEPITGRNAPALLVMAYAVQLLPPGSAFGQSQCGPTPALPAGWFTFPDTCDHLHVQVG